MNVMNGAQKELRRFINAYSACASPVYDVFAA